MNPWDVVVPPGITKVPGVNVRCDKAKLARGDDAPWAIYVEVRFADKTELRKAKFYPTQDAAWARYPATAAEITRRRDAAEEQARLTAALNAPTTLPKAPAGTVLFETLANRWLEERVRPPWKKASTYVGYKVLLTKHLYPIMRTWPVTDAVFSKFNLKIALRDTLRANGAKLPTRVGCQRMLTGFFDWALTELPPKVLQVNPAKGLLVDIRDKSEARIRLTKDPNPMTRVQVESYLTWQQEHYPYLYPLFVWLVDEGSRIGEACALKWPLLNLEAGKGHIQETFSAAARALEIADGNERGRGEQPTKTNDGTEASTQHIDLSDRVVEVFSALKVANRQEWFKRGRRPIAEPEHCILTNDPRKPLAPRRPDKVVYRAHREACDTLGLVGQTGLPFTIHCLRDTFATLSILEGKLDLGWVALQLGHKNEETLKKHYYKWVRLVEANPLAGIKR